MYKLLQIGCLLLCFCCFSTPKTAYNAARERCDLKIKKSYKVLDYTENYSITGDGIVNIVFKLNKDDLNELVEACERKNYKTLSIKNLVDDGFRDTNPAYGINLYNRNILKIAEGKAYYKLISRNLKKLDFSITVLDVTNRELIIYVSIR